MHYLNNDVPLSISLKCLFHSTTDQSTICALLRFLVHYEFSVNVVIFISVNSDRNIEMLTIFSSSLFFLCALSLFLVFFLCLLILYLIFANTRNLVYRIEYCWFSFFFFALLFSFFLFFCDCVYTRCSGYVSTAKA